MQDRERLIGMTTGIADALAISMVGFITERDFEAAEAEFPGIARLFEELPEKPRTFLELVERYIHRDQVSTPTKQRSS
ncbi:MAG TPA: hypothetical protein VFQ53_40675 [Kofleriaceae bacterium]|nr:hypothetical protein [Kofleriaceae bacterium]